MKKGFSSATKHKFIIKNKHKYVGDCENIVCRSSWEVHMCDFLDNNPNVLQWASEEIKIPYIKPTDGKIHTYYPDFLVKYIDKNGDIRCDLIEVKPLRQINPPKNKKSKRYSEDCITYAINVAKWKAAKLFCQQRGINFRLLPENDLFKG